MNHVNEKLMQQIQVFITVYNLPPFIYQLPSIEQFYMTYNVRSIFKLKIWKFIFLKLKYTVSWS